jgi:hypothetical protein
MDPSTKGGAAVTNASKTTLDPAQRAPSAVRKVHAIDDLLDRATFAARTARLTRLLAFGLTIVAALIVGAVVLDASFALTPMGLLLADIALVSAVVVGLVWMVRRVHSAVADPRHIARVIEEKSGVANNQLLNALEFERDDHVRAAIKAAPGSGAISRELVGKTIEAGERLAPQLVASAVVDRIAVRRALLWMPVVPALALLLHLAVPNLFAMTLVRFVDPFGFHPAFTSLAFDVAVSPEQVKHGRAALITVGISGPVRAETAEIVFVDETDPTRELDAVPMVAEPRDDSSAEGFALRIDRAIESRTFLVRTPRGQSAFHRLDVLPVPSFERATVTVQPPEYTKWPPLDRPFGGSDVSALRNSTLQFRAAATLPLSEGRLVLTAPDGSATKIALKANSADPRTVEGELPALGGGTLELELIGVDGTASDERRTATLLVTDDAAPTIRVLEPEEHCFVVEGWSVDVLFEAEDDVGIESIELVRGVNGFPPTTVTLAPSGGDVARTIARAHFDTKELGATAGDVIRCFGVAWDGHPDPPHSARSGMVTIEVLSQEEYAELTRTEERLEELTAEAAKLEEELQKLAEEREKLVKELERIEQAEGNGQSMEEARNDLAQKLEEFAKGSEQLAERMQERAEQQPLYDAEEPWQKSLEKQSEALREQEENAKELAGACQNPGQAGGQRRATAGQKFKESSDPFGEQAMAESGKMIEDLAKLAAAERLLDKVEAVRQAILDQRAMADQMAQFRQKDRLSPQESLQLQDLAEEQQALAERLEKARQELDAAGTESQELLPKMSGQAKEIAKKLEESKARQDQQQASESGRKEEGRQAHESAENAAKKLESLLSECSSEAQQQEMNEDVDGCLKMPKPGMKQAVQQMANARLGQMSSLGKRGQRGGGMSGMSASASIVGPHRPQGKPNRESKKLGGNAETKTAADGDLSPYRSGEAESIDAGAAKATAGAGSLLGVPAAYRDDAAAYFRRIAEDGKRTKNEVSPGANEQQGAKP